MKSIDSEKLLEKKLVEHIKLNGGMCIKLLSNHMIGLPDRLCLFPNAKIAFVELKTTGEKPRKIQLYIHKKLRKLGFAVYVIDNMQSLINFIDSMVYE